MPTRPHGDPGERGVEGCHLKALHLRGFEITVSVRTYRAFCAFLVAQLLVEVSASNADLVLRQPPGPATKPSHGAGYPVLASGHARKFLAAEDYPASSNARWTSSCTP